MPESVSTLKEYGVEDCDRDGTAQLHPGLVLLFSCGRPLATVIRLGNNVIELGRGTHGLPPDPRMSRQHARVSFDGSRFLVTDLGSQNGTSCDGRRIRPVRDPTTVATGGSETWQPQPQGQSGIRAQQHRRWTENIGQLRRRFG